MKKASDEESRPYLNEQERAAVLESVKASDEMPEPGQLTKRKCLMECGTTFWAVRADKVFCGPVCRRKWWGLNGGNGVGLYRKRQKVN